jgi:IS1 family transposase
VRQVAAKKIQCDEIWSFCYAKSRNVADAKAAPDGAGSVWTFRALDAETKLMVSWLVGDRDGTTAYQLMSDLKERITDRIQLTTDGFPAYADAVGAAFGGAVDYAMLVKIYGQPKDGPRGSAERRYSPPECLGCRKTPLSGEPNEADISTSYIERQNLTMRMSMRRFTRLTNAFSKKFENHCHSLALYFCWYNWIRKHKTLGTTPAIAAGLTDKALTMADVAALVDAREQSLIQQRREVLLASPIRQLPQSD